MAEGYKIIDSRDKFEFLKGFIKGSYSIDYKNSLNLKYDSTKNTIHKNYNGWIQNLDNAIQVQLSQFDN